MQSKMRKERLLPVVEQLVNIQGCLNGVYGGVVMHRGGLCRGGKRQRHTDLRTKIKELL